MQGETCLRQGIAASRGGPGEGEKGRERACTHAMHGGHGLGGRPSSKHHRIPPTERKGFVTEADLEAYARSVGLPTSYATNFVSAIVGSSGRGGREVGFKAFSAFVRTRETALRAAFHHFGEGGMRCCAML